MTKIEWTRSADGMTEGKTWNPIRARRKSDGKRGHYCQRISPGCTFCYAATMNVWRGNGVDYTIPGFNEIELYLDMDVLFDPCRWKKPRNIFPCSMTDLFADFVPDWWLRAIYGVMAMCSRHTFMILTKRPERRRQFLTKFATKQEWADYLSELDHHGGEFDGMAVFDEDAECVIANSVNGVLAPGYNVDWPMSNVWEGLSVCTQKEFDELVPVLDQTPAVLRWLSMEPLLEKIEILYPKSLYPGGPPRCCNGIDCGCQGMPTDPPYIYGTSWIVVGGESGKKARSCDPEWIWLIVQQCKEASVRCFVKQMGSQHPSPGDSKGGDMLFWPEHLRVRQYPELRSRGAESVTSRT